MNLMNDPWIPVRCADGHTRRIRPHELTATDNPVVALDAPRPDFNGALAQFLIGLLQTVCAPVDEEQWEDWLWSPPAPETLAQHFTPLAPCFQLDGDGPRFMQDFDIKMAGNKKPIEALLIEAPGDKTLKENADHFIKSGMVKAVCPACTAMALFTLQTNAPSGGQGNRTSLRGGGPLTTLVVFDARTFREPALLWRDLWLNVLLKKEFLAKNPLKTDEPSVWFPWLSPTRTSEKDQKVTSADAHPAVAYWATPRRIRLDFTTIRGTCDVCGTAVEELLQYYTSLNFGANYVDWEHPLSPYYSKTPNSTEWIPQHPQPGGLNYRYWMSCILNHKQTERIAKIVWVFQEQRQNLLSDSQFLAWAFGYDMENMKARCWYETRLPMIDLSDNLKRQLLADFAKNLIDSATEAIEFYLASAIRVAWFGLTQDKIKKLNKDQRNKLKPYNAFIDLVFWSTTEKPFYEQLCKFADALHAGQDWREIQKLCAQEWHRILRQQALTLFDQLAMAGKWEYENSKRLADAYNALRWGLDSNSFKSKLGLAPPPDPDSKSRKGQKRKKS